MRGFALGRGRAPPTLKIVLRSNTDIAQLRQLGRPTMIPGKPAGGRRRAFRSAAGCATFHHHLPYRDYPASWLGIFASRSHQ